MTNKVKEGEVLPKRGPGQPTKYRPEHCDILIDTFAEGGHVADFCQKVGICEKTFYNLVREHEDLSEAYGVAKTRSKALYEKIGFQGMLGQIKGFNFNAWAMIMNNKFKEEYSRALNAPSTEINIGTLNSLTNLGGKELDDKIKRLQKEVGSDESGTQEETAS